MTYYQVMGFFDRVKAFWYPITNEQLRQVFRQEDLEVVAICDVLVLSHISSARGYLVQLASGEGGLFHKISGGRLSVYASSGLHYRWRKGWGLIESPTKFDTDDYFKNHPSFKRDPKTKKIVFTGFMDSECLEMNDDWSFWHFKFWENTNSPNGATEHRVRVAINGKYVNLETLLGSIPIC